MESSETHTTSTTRPAGWGTQSHILPRGMARVLDILRQAVGALELLHVEVPAIIEEDYVLE